MVYKYFITIDQSDQFADQVGINPIAAVRSRGGSLFSYINVNRLREVLDPTNW